MRRCSSAGKSPDSHSGRPFKRVVQRGHRRQCVPFQTALDEVVFADDGASLFRIKVIEQVKKPAGG